MKKILGIILIQIGLYFSSDCQDFSSEFSQYLKEGDSLGQVEVLKKWENNSPDDPELFVAYFNHYVNQARKEVLGIVDTPGSEDAFAIQDSSGETKAFITGQVYYLDTPFRSGLKKIDEGIEKFPNRLDMRFGKLHVLSEAKYWDEFTTELKRTITHSSVNDNAWTWTLGEKLTGGSEKFLSVLQTYQLKFYQSGDNSLLENMREVALKILEFYPDHVESLSNISITYLLTEKYDSAISYLLKAENIDPEDYIVLANIARAYSLKGEKEKAISYYKKVIEFSEDTQTAQFAEQQIKLLSE